MSNYQIVEGAEFPYQYKYPHPAVTADCVIFSFNDSALQVLLVERGEEPYKGHWALPGGFMLQNETIDQCAKRELKEETGIENAYMRQFHVFSNPNRDPRERIMTVAFYALAPMEKVVGGSDSNDAKWFNIDELPELAFDHKDILDYALNEMRKQIHFEPIGFELLPEKFTIKQLQTLYETILGVKFDRRNFYNKMRHFEILTQLDETANPSSKKEAFLFKFNEAKYQELKDRGFRLEF